MASDYTKTPLRQLWKEMTLDERRQSVHAYFVIFLKKYAVALIFLIVAAITCIFVPQESQTASHYTGAINYKTICCFFALMLVIAALQNIKFFRVLSAQILKRVHSIRALTTMLVFLAAFFALFITNDVAILTFIPFSVVMLQMANAERHLPKVVVLQTLACNLSGTISPIGTVQNIYFLDVFNLSGLWFVQNAYVLALVGYGLVLLLCLAQKNEPVVPFDSGKRKMSLPKLFAYALLFALSVVSIFDVWLPKGFHFFWFVTPFAALVVLVLDRHAYKKVNYSLLIMFVAMFITAANLSSIPEVNAFLSQAMQGYEYFMVAGTSEVLLNTTSAVLLAPYAVNVKAFIFASLVSKFGTPITTVANLMVLMMYPSCATRKRFVFTFIFAELGFFAVMFGVGAMLLFL